MTEPRAAARCDNQPMASVCISGLGLIGGSIGMALRRRGWSVSYVDPNVALDEARAAGAADERVETPQGPLLVLATPADLAVAQLGALRDRMALVTSVCSVMQPLCDAAAGITFVAGHPFAGSERNGLGAARPDLFEGRLWFLSRSDEQVERLVRDTGAIPAVIDAAEHDRLLALTSHLPQVVATALGSLLADVDPRFLGSGARSMLRLAGSAYEVWSPILEANATNIEAAADELVRRIERLSAEDFARARRLYETAGGTEH